MALGIVERLGCQELASLVASSTISVPDAKNVEEGVIILWLGRSVNGDIATVGWLAGLVVGKSDMTILFIKQSDHVPRGCLQPRATGGLELRLLGLLAHRIGWLNVLNVIR